MKCDRQISASGEKMYHDAYTLQKVEPEHLSSFNFAAGMVPFLLNLIQDVSRTHCIGLQATHVSKVIWVLRVPNSSICRSWSWHQVRDLGSKFQDQDQKHDMNQYQGCVKYTYTYLIAYRSSSRLRLHIY